MMEPTTWEQAERTKKFYVCSSCWSELQIYPTENRQAVCNCPACENCRGYVSKRWVKNQQSKSHADAAEARHALRESVPWMKINKSQDEILKDLGF